MVESGSTTTYRGNGIPFPNWLVYDSSLFQVKVNGKPATFFAPAPMYDNDTFNRVNFDYSNTWLNNDLNTDIPWQNLLVNIDSDGFEGTRTAWYTKEFLVDHVIPGIVEGEESQVDFTKALYLYSADYATMSGKPIQNGEESPVNIFNLPYIKCEELNLIIYYDMDANRWRIYHGEIKDNIVIQWRFKELCSLDKSPPFLETENIRWNSAYIYPDAFLNPFITVIPNVVDTTKVEIHARTIILPSDFESNERAPRYMGKTMCTWPNLHEALLVNPNRASDESLVMLPISNIMEKGNIIVRLNNKPARIIENTISEDYSVGVFSNDSGYVQAEYTGTYTPVVTEEPGYIRITDGVNVLQYTAKNAQWSIVSGTDQFVTVEIMFLIDANITIYGRYVPYITSYGNMMYDYVGFVLTNPINHTSVALTATDNVNKYLNHEQISSRNNLSIVPNFESYGIDAYNCYINGLLVNPIITYGINESLVRVQYTMANLPNGLIDINISNYWANIDVDFELLNGRATSPSGYTYLLDGDRDTNLDMNPETCLFNRYIPVNIYWEFVGEASIDSRIPIFISYEYNQANVPGYGNNAMSGIYLNHYYNGANKTATLSISPNVTASDNGLHPSLTMVHERDIIRGWKLSGYTGRPMSFNDVMIRKNSIGFPIVIKEDPVEVSPIPTLPITLEALGFSATGTFDIVANGEILASNVSGDDLVAIMANDPRFTVTDTGEVAPSQLTIPSHTGDVELIGEFDLYINNELVVTDITSEMLVEFGEVGNGDTLLFVPTLPLPPPPPPEPMPSK